MFTIIFDQIFSRKATKNTKFFLRTILLFILLSLIFGDFSKAQVISVKLGKNNIASNEYFTITVTIKNQNMKNYSKFPDIPGFTKRGTSSSSSTNIINRKVTFSQSITQNYLPQKEGTYRLKPFTIFINGKKISSKGTIIKVGPAKKQRYDPYTYDPFGSFFGRKSQPKKFVDVKENAFFTLTTNKDEVYVGEGLNTTLALYVSAKNRAEMQFYNLGNQLTDMIKKIKPANCWEENFNIEQIEPESITINNNPYTRYKIYEITFFPLNTEPLLFPSVGLKMIKYKIAKNPTFFGTNKKRDFKTFWSKPRIIKVKELPPHPLKDIVSVGNYWLEEGIGNRKIKTGESFTYNFKIRGEGNISSINNPEIPVDDKIEFYPPNIRQAIRRSNGRVTGAKSFSYYAIPNEPGEFNISDYFSWIYFNPQRKQYDTLRSKIKINVTGESSKNTFISSKDLGNFYNNIPFKSNSPISLNSEEYTKFIMNVLLLLMVVVTAVLMFRR